ncbi:MAG: sigma 54-interacting transcriptional regulator [Candidatus Fimivivens sp.]|nr:sigma 54-interacting transcriptional regulator [Candidatus Fimivivens sp.]
MFPEKSEICLIAPTESLAERARAIINQQGLNIQVYTAALEEAVTLAKTLIKQKTWLFISRRGTRDLLEKELHTTVVNIPIEASDYIPAIQQAQKIQGKIAFFSFETCSNQLQTICYLLHIDMQHYQFSDSASCRECVKQAIQDGAVMGIGGIISGIFAEEFNLPYIVVESSDSSILQAIETARQIYTLQKENEFKQEQLEIKLERFHNILNYTHDAIIAVDDKGRIEVTNRVAERLLDQKHRPYEGKAIEEVLPNTHIIDVLKSGRTETDQIMNISGTIVSTNRIPIVVNRQIKGVVATFQDVKSLQNAERSVRIKLHEKGLTAKYRFADIIGHSKILQSAKSLAENFADSPFTIMIYGETGTGKEMFAQSIHNASSRRDGPFVAVNCTALSKNLLESELFGYDDSSFTGAKRGGKPGLFEIAHSGTIFLDEIGELPLEFQAQFLRVLQEKEVRRIGGDTMIPVDVRVIGATNRDLLERVEQGNFRKDLYYRLNVLNLLIPPLCDREDDYLLIATSMYSRIVPELFAEYHSEFIQVMQSYRGYPWPGNIRELNNVVKRICLLQKRGLNKDRIFESLMAMTGNVQTINPLATLTAANSNEPDSLSKVQHQQILVALKRNSGNISRTAKELKISRSTLYRKIAEQKNV